MRKELGRGWVDIAGRKKIGARNDEQGYEGMNNDRKKDMKGKRRSVRMYQKNQERGITRKDKEGG